ncbi:MAG: YIP1 family protein [Anaerolineales bacterium]
MNEEATTSTPAPEMSAMQKVIGIFTAPRQTFEAIDQKPTWVLPFLIGIVFFLIFQILTVDIQMSERMELMEAQGRLTPEQLDAARTQMQGPAKYAGLIAGPIVWLIMIVILAAIFYMTANLMIGGDSSFKKVFAIVCWSGLIGAVSLIVMTLLILSKGTMQGVALDLTIFLDTPPIGAEKSTLYRIFSKFDVFTIWQIILWIIGLSVTYKTTIKKAAVPLLSLWGVWILVSVALGPFFERLGM